MFRCAGVTYWEYELVDEDDLMYALQNKQISKKQYHEAYIIAHQLMIEIEENFSEVQDKVMHCYNKIYHKSLRNKHKRPFKPKISTNITDVKQSE